MPKLVSMKRTEKKKKRKGLANESVQDAYPYGLGLSLGAPELKKLGLKVKELKAGEKVRLTATAVIESISAPVGEQPYEELGVSLKITDLFVERSGEDEFASGFKEAVKRNDKESS